MDEDAPPPEPARAAGKSPLRAVRIVLVRPKTPGNVGSVARAMRNLGFDDLVVVSPRRFRRASAEKMAVHGQGVLDSMRIVKSMEEALEGVGWVVGTTARAGVYRSRLRAPRDLAPDVLAAAKRNRVALVFGPEDTGLSNEDLKHCHELATIPTDPAYSSLNVAQAALVFLYELHVAAAPSRAEKRLAPAERVEQMLAKLQEALLAIGFLPEANPHHVVFALRRLFGRARLDEREVRIWLGVARQIGWFAKEGREVLEEKRRRGVRAR